MAHWGLLTNIIIRKGMTLSPALYIANGPGLMSMTGYLIGTEVSHETQAQAGNRGHRCKYSFSLSTADHKAQIGNHY